MIEGSSSIKIANEVGSRTLFRGGNTAPDISVIVTAHDRKEFICDALKTVLHQNMHRSSYEIIVVKNYQCHELDKYLEKNNIINIYTDKTGIGEKLALGILQARGRIICFLEDDDLFSPDKLQYVLRNFDSVENLGYLHNSFDVIGRKGAPINETMYKTVSTSTILTSDSKDNLSMSFVVRNGAFPNISATSVRSDILLRFIEYIPHIKRGPDACMFYIAMESDASLLIDSEKQTLYRKHNSMSNFNTDFQSFLNWNSESNSEIIDELELLLRYINNETTTSFLVFHIQEFRMLRNLTDRSMKRKSKIQVIGPYFSSSLRFKVPYAYLIIGLNLLGLISSTLSAKFYFRRYRKALLSET